MVASCGKGLRAATPTASLITVALLAVGCAGGHDRERMVKTSQVEKGIETSLSTSSVKVTHVSCPSNVPVQKGATFSCNVSLSNGGTGKVTVTQQGANHYTYAFTAGSVQVPGATAAASIEKSLAAQGASNAAVACPETIVVKVGSTVTCNVSGAEGVANGTVTFTFSESDGTIDPESIK